MPKGTRVARLVEHLKAKGYTGGSPYAIAQSVTHQSYATGKPLPRKGKRLVK
jgi:hypothetical protein